MMKVITRLLFIVLALNIFGCYQLKANMLRSYVASLDKKSIALVSFGVVAIAIAVRHYFAHTGIDFALFVKKNALLCENDNIKEKIPFRQDTVIERLINAERMRECIKRHKLHRLAVTEKYLHKSVCGCQWKLYVRWIAEPQCQQDQQPCSYAFDLELVQQLAKLAEETGFYDWQKTNWLFDYDDGISVQGKLTFIDTENRSFQVGENYKWYFVESLFQLGEYMSQDAQQWLVQRVADLKLSAEGNIISLPLPCNTQFDDPAINIENVKRYYNEYARYGD